MVEHFAAFVAVSALVIVTPGPDMALVARNALRGGRRGAIATAVGIVSGLAAWTHLQAARPSQPPPPTIRQEWRRAASQSTT